VPFGDVSGSALAQSIQLPIQQSITAATGQPFSIQQYQTISGGSINRAYSIAGGQQQYFLKLNHARRRDMFDAEASGLTELASTHAIHVPTPLCTGSAGEYSWLVTEYISFGRRQSDSARLLGEQLAAQHQHIAVQFGWFRDNTIGSTPQHNSRMDNWINFYREQRLRFQFDLAASNGFTGLQDKGAQLMAGMDVFFSGYHPQPSLLHGDLWAGNQAIDGTGQPVIFDPAVYYGDREADIAMTELFGAFPPGFYAAYNAHNALDPGYAVRKTLYNLYHILNHTNLFGGSYAAQAAAMTDQLLSEIS